jgi:hypothetical protein
MMASTFLMSWVMAADILPKNATSCRFIASYPLSLVEVEPAEVKASRIFCNNYSIFTGFTR